MDSLPPSLRAVSGHYADSDMSAGEGREAIGIQLHVEDRKEDFLEEIFGWVEEELEREFDSENVSFSYDTKLTFPAELALGYVYENASPNLPSGYSILTRQPGSLTDRFVEPIEDKKHRRREKERIEGDHEQLLEEVERAEELTDLVIGLLIEGDMRDALHDEEYEDFVTRPSLPGRTVAETAKETLQENLKPRLDGYPGEVEKAYEEAVELSMEHQREDQEFREMFERARDSSGGEKEILSPYRDADTRFPFSLDWTGTELPYFVSQYERVGVLYDGMFEMYDRAGIDIEDDFKRSIVLATIGAQIWLDDVDDLLEDWKNSQLTPVTAEILSSGSGEETYQTIVSLKDEYLDTARFYARSSNSDLAGIGIEYIDLKGGESNLEEEVSSLR